MILPIKYEKFHAGGASAERVVNSHTGVVGSGVGWTDGREEDNMMTSYHSYLAYR